MSEDSKSEFPVGVAKRMRDQFHSLSDEPESPAPSHTAEDVVKRPGAAAKLIRAFSQPASPGPASTLPNDAAHITSGTARTIIQDIEKRSQKAVKLRNVLIVYAHNEKKSFNAALCKKTQEVLEEQGHTVEVSDLFAQKFNPCYSRAIIRDMPADNDVTFGKEDVLRAVKNKSLSRDVLEEQRKVTAADLIIFEFPLYSFSMPAIIKGWVDKVLLNGFSYDSEHIFSNGKMKGKRAMLSFTTGEREAAYAADALLGDLDVLLWPMQFGMLHFHGFSVLPPNICFAPGSDEKTHEMRVKMLENWGSRLKTLFDEEPLQFIPVTAFNLPEGSYTLTAEALGHHAARQPTGLTTGHHLHKLLPAGHGTGTRYPHLQQDPSDDVTAGTNQAETETPTAGETGAIREEDDVTVNNSEPLADTAVQRNAVTNGEASTPEEDVAVKQIVETNDVRKEQAGVKADNKTSGVQSSDIYTKNKAGRFWLQAETTSDSPVNTGK